MRPIPPPRVLVIDDFFGRQVVGGMNRDRMVLCEKFGLRDVSPVGAVETPLLEASCADAVFLRGQVPDPARTGDSVRNDLDSSVRAAIEGWTDVEGRRRPWTMVVLDLMFYTGLVTPESDRLGSGMPQGTPSDDRPDTYFGLEILRGIRQLDPDLPVLILSSKNREDVSRTFSELGASGFLERDAADAAERFHRHLARHGLNPAPALIGASRALLVQLRRARLLAEGGGSVLIRGEPGTGKELLARFLHESSPRCRGPFESRSLANIPRDLAESELFGHVKGAFTGAVANRLGAFEAASGGTLFLDEVGDASPELQAKLLRVLETGMIQRVGGEEQFPVDVRILSATNVDIEGRALRGEGFRSDLLARLRQAGTITMPPLRDRKEDIPDLAEHFVRIAEASHGSAMKRDLLPESFKVLMKQSWPGNVRELRNCISQAVYRHPDVEFLAPMHIEEALAADNAVAGSNPIGGAGLAAPDVSLATLIEAVSAFAAREGDPLECDGALPEVQLAWTRLVARLVVSSIRRTKRPTVDHPGGDVLIHPAMKLLSGNAQLTATQAADLVKRLLLAGPPGSPVPILPDKDLSTALEAAQRLRPGGGQRTVR
jgi:DNA-binding NtrC family response regulator